MIEQHPFAIDRPEPIRLTVSIGLCTFHYQEPTDVQGLIKKADDALLKAKEEGRNRVIVA